MTEDEARDWIAERFGVERLAALDHYGALLLVESDQQNLIARSTRDAVWTRHILDSAQLLTYAAPASPGGWIDIGSGAGLPGLVVAVLTDWRVTLVEPRRLRVAFLQHCIAELGLTGRVDVVQAMAAKLPPRRAAVISARAVANLSALLAECAHLSTRETLWILPKGANAKSEVEAARRSWQGVFHVEQSLIDPASGIVVARGVARR